MLKIISSLGNNLHVIFFILPSMIVLSLLSIIRFLGVDLFYFTLFSKNRLPNFLSFPYLYFCLLFCWYKLLCLLIPPPTFFLIYFNVALVSYDKYHFYIFILYSLVVKAFKVTLFPKSRIFSESHRVWWEVFFWLFEMSFSSLIQRLSTNFVFKLHSK